MIISWHKSSGTEFNFFQQNFWHPQPQQEYHNKHCLVQKSWVRRESSLKKRNFWQDSLGQHLPPDCFQSFPGANVCNSNNSTVLLHTVSSLAALLALLNLLHTYVGGESSAL